MNKFVLLSLSAALACTIAHAQGQLDFNNPTIPEVTEKQNGLEAVSGHAVSLTILGLEYSYELALGGSWSMIFRAGFPCVLSNVLVEQHTESEMVTTGTVTTAQTNSQTNYFYYVFPRPGITVEPRYYTNLQRRYLKGKKTINNSADFVSVQTKVYATSLQRVDLSLIPTYGIRRAGKHWFREYTIGVGFHTMALHTPTPVLPHLGFRFGYEW